MPAIFCSESHCAMWVLPQPGGGGGRRGAGHLEPAGGWAQPGTRAAFGSLTCRDLLLLPEHSSSQGVEGKQPISRLVLKFSSNYSLHHHLGDFLITA